jgi:hypothetical protein
MATIKLNSFSFEDLSVAIAQIFNSQRFWTVISCLLTEPKFAIMFSIMLHGHYTSSFHLMLQHIMAIPKVSHFFLIFLFGPLLNSIEKVRFQGTKFLVHRVTFRHKHHPHRLDDQLELSHVINCGLRTPS